MAVRSPAVNEWLQWCAYGHWESSEFGFEICTFIECGKSVTVTCFLAWDGPEPVDGLVALLAEGLMQFYRNAYLAIARGEPGVDASFVRRDVLGMQCQTGDWGRTDGSDTGAYPPYRYEANESFFHIDLLHPEDNDHDQEGT